MTGQDGGDDWRLKLVHLPSDEPALERAYMTLIVDPSRHGELAELAGRALSIDKSVAAAWKCLAMLHAIAGRDEPGIGAAFILQALDPANAVAHHLLGRYLRDGTHKTASFARNHAARAEYLAPDWLENIILHAAITGDIGPESEALRLWRRSVALDPGYAFGHWRLASLLAANGHDLDDAIRHLTLAVELAPHVAPSALADLTELRAAKARQRSKAIIARYPETENLKRDLPAALRKYVIGSFGTMPPFLTRDCGVLAMGSCFARNMGRVFQKLGYPTFIWEFADDINSTFANRAVMDWLDGTLAEPMAGRVEKLLGPAMTRAALEQAICTSDLFILTLGVAPVFFDRRTNEFVLPSSTGINQRSLAEKFESRTTTVTENCENVRAIYQAVKRRNPRAKIFMSVSPVPLRVSFEFDSAVQADCISKSTLRVTAHELMKSGLPDLHYWPSFEIVRWIGGHVGPFFGTDDGSVFHVSEALVDQIIKLFIETFEVPNGLRPAAEDGKLN